MGTLNVAGILQECSRLGIRLESQDGSVVCRTPREQVPDWLVAALKAHKAALTSMLANEPVTAADRREAHRASVERQNAAYRGGPIDWPKLDGIWKRIREASTRRELTMAIADLEAAVGRGGLKPLELNNGNRSCAPGRH